MRNNDSPEKFESQDLLNRSGLVKTIADELMSLDLADGAVTAIVGPWGVGKSTLLEFIKPHLDSKHTIVEFNPWLFSSAEDLIITFFKELQRELVRDQRQFSEVVDALTPYLEALEYVKFDPNTAAFAYVIGTARRLVTRKKPSVIETKAVLTKTLRSVDRRLVVFIDDLDRLQPQEALDVLRLVRLVGSLPNVLYVLSFDDERLAKTISEEEHSGHDYLEKIIYIAWRVPGVDIGTRRKLIYAGLDGLLDRTTIKLAEGEAERLRLAVEELLIHFLTNIRKIKRYFAVVNLAVDQFAGEIDLTDLLCLEALRLYERPIFDLIANNAFSLSWSKDFLSIFNDPRKLQSAHALGQLLECNPSTHIKWVTRELFPIAWNCRDSSVTAPTLDLLLRQNRVSHIAILLHYLDRFESRELISRRKFARILRNDIDVEENLEELKTGTDEEASDVCDLLLGNTELIPQPKRIRLAAYLLDVSSYASGDSQYLRFLSFEGNARKLITNLLRHLSDDDRIQAENTFYSNMESIEARFLFICDLAHPINDNGDSQLCVTPHRLKQRLLEDFSSMSIHDMERMRRLCWIANALSEDLDESQLDMPNFLSSPQAAWNLLRSSVSIRSSRSMNRPNVEILRTLLGGEDQLSTFLEFLTNNPNAKDADLDILKFAIEDSAYAEDTGEHE